MSKAKAILFWVAFLPIGLVMVVIGFFAWLFNALDDALYIATRRFEWWALEHKDEGVIK